jgi:hypothetical protein
VSASLRPRQREYVDPSIRLSHTPIPPQAPFSIIKRAHT